MLAGEPWSDSPPCTDRALGDLARRVNDDVAPEARSALAGIAPRLVGTVGLRAARDVVTAAVLRVGLESAPDDVVLTRFRRRVESRILPADGPGSGVWARVVRRGRLIIGPGLPGAYLQVVRAMSAVPRADRDAVRVRALAAATEDVRRRLEAVAAAPSAPSAPATASPRGAVVRSG